MPSTVVNINSAWLTTNAPASGQPYVLTGPNVEYVLQQDVFVSGSLGGRNVFSLPTGGNVELNLNGYNVYINNYRVLQQTDSELTRSTETTRAKHGYPVGNAANDSIIAGQAGAIIQNKTTTF